MKPSITDNKREQAHAQLALKAVRGTATAVGEQPSLEELCALRDGQLDDTRRAQLLAYMADDEQIYQQWIGVLDANPMSAAAHEQGVAAESKPGFFARLGLSGFRAPWAIGSAVAAVFAVSILVRTPQLASVDNPQLDQLYSDYGSSWAASPATLPPLAIRSSGHVKSASAARQALFVGAEAGLQELGSDFTAAWLPKLDIDPDTVNDIDPDLFSSLHSSGKLTTLAHFKCQLQGGPEFFARTSGVLDELRGSLLKQQGELALTLAESIAAAKPAKEKVCGFARQVVAELNTK